MRIHEDWGLRTEDMEEVSDFLQGCFRTGDRYHKIAVSKGFDFTSQDRGLWCQASRRSPRHLTAPRRQTYIIRATELETQNERNSNVSLSYISQWKHTSNSAMETSWTFEFQWAKSLSYFVGLTFISPRDQSADSFNNILNIELLILCFSFHYMVACLQKQWSLFNHHHHSPLKLVS